MIDALLLLLFGSKFISTSNGSHLPVLEFSSLMTTMDGTPMTTSVVQDVERRLDECEYWLLRLWKLFRGFRHEFDESVSSEYVLKKLVAFEKTVQSDMDNVKRQLKNMKGHKGLKGLKAMKTKKNKKGKKTKKGLK